MEGEQPNGQKEQKDDGKGVGLEEEEHKDDADGNGVAREKDRGREAEKDGKKKARDRSESPARPPPVPDVVDGRFEVGKMIGKGSYSDVHIGIDSTDGKKVAIKFEWQKAEKGKRLLHEAELYTSMATGNEVPSIIWAGTYGEWNVMVMELLGPSLEDLFKGRGRKFSMKTVVMLGIQMVDRLEYVHEKGILHRDIKPHNFLMGVGEHSGLVYIMDFGLSRTLHDPETGEHIPCKKKKGLTGTVRYTSLNVHKGLEPSRRDDLGAVGYVLMHFNRGKLPWQGIDAKSKRTKQRRIGRCKDETSLEKLCEGFPNEFVQFLQHCDSTAFDAKPDYNYLRRLLRDIAKRENMELDWKFDWMLPQQDLDDGGDANGKRSPSRKRARDKATRSKSPKARKLGAFIEGADKLGIKDEYDSSYYYDEESEEEESEEDSEEEEEESKSKYEEKLENVEV